MSNEEQQLDELETLKAIYPTEFTLFPTTDDNDDEDQAVKNEEEEDKCLKFSIKVSSESNYDDDDDDDCDKYEMELFFRLPKEYPESVGPEIKILNSKNLEPKDELEILEILNDLIKENLGIVLVFILITKAFEWINLLKERKLLERKEEKERKKQELEELERKKFEGTRVTVESFIAWKLKFDAEMAELAAKNKEQKNKEFSGKLTGKEMFLRDKNLIDSDLNFLDEQDLDPDYDIKVDESLFENDELIDELDDDDDDDPDYQEEEDDD